jgi:hypothetical protein
MTLADYYEQNVKDTADQKLRAPLFCRLTKMAGDKVIVMLSQSVACREVK